MRFKADISQQGMAKLKLLSLVPLATMFMTFSTNKFICFGLALPFLLLIFITPLTTCYILKEDHLCCKDGPFLKKTIAYDNIKKLRNTNHVPAHNRLSTRCVEITEHNKSGRKAVIYVAPYEREIFLDELTKRCKNLEKTDE